MTKREIMDSIALKKKFCKDCSIPIAVYDNPYFIQRLQILNPVNGGIKKFKIFCDGLKRFKNEQEYFSYYNQVKDSVISAIKDNEEYQNFITGTYDVHSKYMRRNVYVEENDRKAFISIDMKKANYSSLRHFSEEIFGNSNTWEEFISRFTDNEHIISSKYIRQVIMGACNPGKQIQYEKFLMSKLLDHIIGELPTAKVFSLGNDEIILSVEKGCGFSLNKLESVILSCADQIGHLVCVKMFNLEKICGTDGWAKFNYDGSVEFKCLDSDTIHQVVKYYYGKEITKDDLIFINNGRLATYLEGIDNPWKESAYQKMLKQS